jgi:hypothetical protein
MARMTPRPNERSAFVAFALACRRWQVLPSRDVLVVNIRPQTVAVLQRMAGAQFPGQFPRYALRQRLRCSTSRFGIGSVSGSNCTPLGLHCIAEKIGGGQPVGTVFKGRQIVGRTWQGLPDAAIVHRILWLDGLEPGLNRGGNLDTHARYIYIHGFGDETTLGRPMSHGCVHLAAADLIPLFDRLPSGTMVWIGEA